MNEALRLIAARDGRLRALDEFLATYEGAHGEITEDEMRDAARRASARAVVARGKPDANRVATRRRLSSQPNAATPGRRPCT